MGAAAHSRIALAMLLGFGAVAWLARPGSDPALRLPGAALAPVAAAEVPVAAVHAELARMAAGPLPAASQPGAVAAAERAQAQQRFLHDARGLLAMPAPPAEKLATLRRAPPAAPHGWQQLFAQAVAEPTCREAPAAGDSPAEYALQRLVRACATDPAARAALGGLVFGPAELPASLRERAARAYAATAGADEVPRLAARVAVLADPQLRVALTEGLAAASAR